MPPNGNDLSSATDTETEKRQIRAAGELPEVADILCPPGGSG
jgi:hypothetical protein